MGSGPKSTVCLCLMHDSERDSIGSAIIHICLTDLKRTAGKNFTLSLSFFSFLSFLHLFRCLLMLMLQPRSGWFGNEDAGGGGGVGVGVGFRKAALFRLLFIVFIILSIFFPKYHQLKHPSLLGSGSSSTLQISLSFSLAILSSCIKLIISCVFFFLNHSVKRFQKKRRKG